jgi:hypothetical protein
LLFTSHAANRDCLLTLSVRVVGSLVLAKVLAHECAMVCFRQLHWINLRAKERNLRALSNSALDLFDDCMTVTLVFSEQERCGVMAALELCIGLQGATSLRLVHL